MATSFIENDIEYITAGKKSVSPSNGGLQYLSYQVEYVTIKCEDLPSLFCFLSFLLLPSSDSHYFRNPDHVCLFQ